MGSIRGKAHPLPNSSSGVVMDIAAFKVNHCAEWDKDATALQATSSTQLVQRGDGMLHVGSIRGKAHRLPGTHIAKVSIPVGRWMKVQGGANGGNVAEGSKGEHSAHQKLILR